MLLDADAGSEIVDEPALWQLEAAMTGDSWSFAYTDGNVRVEGSREVLRELADFEALKVQRLHIMFSEGGWLRIILGWVCIILGPVFFIVFGRFFGLLPATFACVFVSALGDRDTTLRGATILSAGVTVFGMRFDLDILSAVITCVLALRWVFRS